MLVHKAEEFNLALNELWDAWETTNYKLELWSGKVLKTEKFQKHRHLENNGND